MEKIKFSAAGDQGIMMEFGTEIKIETNRKIRAMVDRLQQRKEVVELIPTFCSLLVLYDCRKASYEKIKKLLLQEVGFLKEGEKGRRIVHKIPVCYEREYGGDLPFVATYTGFGEEEIIALHSGREYFIYMLGFLPGFAYLGGMDERLICPRLESPRVKIPAGSVGIGGEQTGIYPLESPGGWRLIGRTPIRPYQPNGIPTILYQMGEYIMFDPITATEYADIERKVEQGTYHHQILEYE